MWSLIQLYSCGSLFCMLKYGPSILSENRTTSDSLIRLIALSVTNTTDWSMGVIERSLVHTSLDIGLIAAYVPVEDTDNAHTPSDVNAISGNCPNCPCESALVAAASPIISPVPTVLIPLTGKR